MTLEGLALTDRLFLLPNITLWVSIRFSEVSACAGLTHSTAPPTLDWADALGGECVFLRPDVESPGAFWLGVLYGLPGGQLMPEVEIELKLGTPREVRLNVLRKQHL